MIDMFAGEHRSPEFMKINPMGKVPALIDDDFNVYDSHAIAIYMVEKFAKDDSMYPKDLKLRTVVNQRLFFDASYLFQRLYEVLIPLYYGQHKEIPESKLVEVHMAYKIIEGFFDTGNAFVTGDTFTIADASIWTTLGSFRLLVPIEASKYPKLSAWLDLMGTRETAEINNTGAQEHFAFIQRCINGQPIRVPLKKE
jgi:glutathione S-transferase